MNKQYLCLAKVLTLATFIAIVNSTPLDDYVKKPDPVYGFNLIKTYDQQTYTVYVLNFTSQKWYDGESSAL